MRRLSRLPALLGGLASLFIASPALALETSFHTYDGFAETVGAFRLVSMIFADPRYETLVLIVAVVGMALGAVLAMIRGTGMGLVAFGLQMLVGIGLFVGLVATTGTVHVYDRVRNAYQPVGDVPNLIVLVAGVTNMMERALAETIDDNTLDPHAKLEFGAGGHAFDLFLNAVSPYGPMTDAFLDATIKDYVRQCYPVARVSPAYGIDDDQLFRTSTDLPASFAAMAGPSTFSTVFTASEKGGTTVSCNEAWTHIADRLSNPVVFEDYSSQVCQRTGYDIAKADQLARCRSNLDEIGDMMLGTPLTAQAFFTNILLGNSVGDVLFEDSPATAARVMANRAVVAGGLATMSTANEWMPTIRATVFGIMLFMMPIALLFILTPINLRVASFALGLFVFVALWGVIEAGIYQLTLGRAMAVLAEMRSNHVAATTWMLAPSSAMKALAIFGSFRTAAAGLAGAFVFTVFRFSGNVFSSFTAVRLASRPRDRRRRRGSRPPRASPRHWRRRPRPWARASADQQLRASEISASVHPSEPTAASAPRARLARPMVVEPPAAPRWGWVRRTQRANWAASRPHCMGATSMILQPRAQYAPLPRPARSTILPRRTRCAA